MVHVNEGESVALKARVSFNLRTEFPSDADEHTKNEAVFRVMRRQAGSAVETEVDAFSYDMRMTYPIHTSGSGHISVPSFSTKDKPGEGAFEYRIAVETRVARGGSKVDPVLQIDGLIADVAVA